MLSPARPLSSSVAPSKPRSRANTLTSPSAPPLPHVAPVNLSASLSRSYHQPVGTGSLRRQQQQLGSRHGRSRSTGDAVAATSAGVGTGGRRRTVFCDVVVDAIELDEDGQVLYPVGASRTALPARRLS